MSIDKRYRRGKSAVLQWIGVEPPKEAMQAANGEFLLLRYFLEAAPPKDHDSIIDVGAARGDWSAEALHIFRDKISSFAAIEPMPDNANAVRQRFAREQTMVVHECSLADRDAPAITMYNVAGGGRISAPRSGRKPVSAVTVPVATGDSLFAGARPYLIKIDCEGYDAKVLRGFEKTLQTARPLLQFEYCDMWMNHDSRLQDTTRQLEDARYNMYRLWPDGIVGFRFSKFYETYHYQNIVAVPVERNLPRGEIRFV